MSPANNNPSPSVSTHAAHVRSEIAAEKDAAPTKAKRITAKRPRSKKKAPGGVWQDV